MQTEINISPFKVFPQLYRTVTFAPTKKRLAEQAFKPLYMDKQYVPSFQELMPEFCRFQKYDDKADSTITKYQECLSWVQRYLPHINSPLDLKLDDLMILKEKMLVKKLSLSRINHILTSLRMFLQYCGTIAGLLVIDFNKIKITKLPPHEVESLEEEELKQFLESINPETLHGLRMRALAEFFVSTCSRPTAGLSVDYANIKWEQNGIGEVTVMGKGNRANILFITARAGEWIKRYMLTRTDTNPALFVTFGTAKRMTGNDLHKLFKHYSKQAGFNFTINPQMLRRTMATIAREKGADVFTVKEVLNHSRVETTTKHYIGRNKKVLKLAHAKYVNLD